MVGLCCGGQAEHLEAALSQEELVVESLRLQLAHQEAALEDEHNHRLRAPLGLQIPPFVIPIELALRVPKPSCP